MIFVRDRSFYRQLAAITIPIALQNLINVGVSVADTMMIGALGEIQLSSVSIANQLGFVLMLLSFGMGGGAGVLIAQYWGKRDVEAIHRVFTVAYRVMFFVSLVFFTLAVFFPARVMGVFTTDAAVINEGAVFLRIIGLLFPVWSLTTITVNMLRAVRAVNVSVAVSLSAFVVNIFLNWVLIFGNLGAPALGVVGGALATAVSRVVELAVACVYLFRLEKNVRYRPKMLFAKRLGEGALISFAETALPVAANELFWSMGSAAIAVVVGRMGREVTAAQAISSVLFQFVTIVLFAMANSSAVMTGNTIGEGNYARVKQYAVTFLALSGVLGVVSGGVVLLLRDFMLARYNISELAQLYGTQVINMTALLVPFQALACTIIVGVLRGGGDTRYAAVMDVIFMWTVSIPLGFFTGLYLKWPVWAVFLVLRSDEIIKVLVTLPRVFKGNWITDLTIKQ